MSLFSKLFGESIEGKGLRETLAHIHRILDDEKLRLELVNPTRNVWLRTFIQSETLT